MIDRTCRHCARSYPARNTAQRFCSKSCATSARQPRTATTGARREWGKRTPLDKDHRRLRALLLPAAVGTPCPLRISPGCTVTMTDPTRMQLDHIIPRALGGTSTRDNVRFVCSPCNHYAGAQLGGRIRSARKHHDTATRRQLPTW